MLRFQHDTGTKLKVVNAVMDCIALVQRLAHDTDTPTYTFSGAEYAEFLRKAELWKKEHYGLVDKEHAYIKLFEEHLDTVSYNRNGGISIKCKDIT